MVGLWIGDLLKNTPLLEDYVNTAELSRFLQSSEIDTGKFMEVKKALPVAYWLRSYDIQSKHFNLTSKMCRNPV